MPTTQKVVPSSPNSSNLSASTGQGDQILDGIILNSFKLKPVGTGATRNTLVENDSLSSYSWPEETKRQNRAKLQPGEKASSGASRDSSENGHSGSTTLSPKRHTVIDIDQLAEPVLEPTYVEAYMKFMYWTCVSPYKPARSGDCSGKNSWCDLVLNIIQKIFSVIIGFSLVKSFFQVKFFIVFYMTFSDMEIFVDMMFYIMNAATKVYYVYLFVVLQKQFSQMLLCLDKLRAFRMRIPHINSEKRYTTMRYAMNLGISSIIMSLIQTIWYSPGYWTPEKGILFHSYSTALGLFIWSKETMGNGTSIESIQQEYKNEMNTTNILLGTFGLITHLCSSLQNEATADLMLTQAETVKEEMHYLQKRITKTDNDEENVTLTGLFRENGEWTHSRLLTNAMNTCNDTLDLIMKYKHVNNLMLYVFFVLNLFDGDYSVAFLVYLLYGICKSSYTYRIAAEASTLNESKRDWICRLAWKSKDEEFHKKVALLLVEIKAKPIGMGRGQFMINESFLYRFLGWVGSVFVIQAQSRESGGE